MNIKNVSFIGLGVMGYPMAGYLKKNDFNITVFNRTNSKSKKWVEEFKYEGSPQFTGEVPTYDLVDMQISKKIPKYSATLKVGSSNLLNNQHFEVYGGPYIGRMTYISLLFELK